MRYLLFICLFFLLTGCSDYLQEDINAPVSIDSREKMINALTGVYYRLNVLMIGNEGSSFYGNPFSGYAIPNSFGDDFNHSYLNGPTYRFVNSKWKYFCDKSTWSDLYSRYNTEGPWENIYKTILSINNILIQFRNKETSVEMKELLGEVYLIRAYMYYRLVRTYGEVPLITDTDVSYKVPKSTIKDVYNFIESDLKIAIDYLPVNSFLAREPHVSPHKGTAKAILAEVYLTEAGYPLKETEYYRKAAELSKNIIDSAKYYGFGLLSDYADLWLSNILNHEESIFSLRIQKQNMWIGYNMGIGYINDSILDVSPPTLPIAPTYAPGIKFFNEFPKSYRKKVNFATIFLKPTILFKYGINEYEYIEYDSMDFCTTIFYNKFAIEYHPVLHSKVNFDTLKTYFVKDKLSNLYIFRFAQTLLTYAEAKLYSGQLDASAYEAVNMVRRRANKLDIYSPSPVDLKPGLTEQQFADSVLWERAWELCGEPEGRWFDLVRHEMVEEIPALRVSDDMVGYPDKIDKDFYLQKIPDSEIILNPNLE